MNAAKKHSSKEIPIQSNGHAIDLEDIRAQARRLNFRTAKQERPKTQAVDWVEVQSEEPSSPVAKRTSASPLIEVRVGATYTVNVPPGFNKAAFTEVCKILSGLCQ
jgi:hypothetical protein